MYSDMKNMKRIETQIKYIEQVVAELNDAYDNRADMFALHGLFGRAIGALKGVQETLEDVVKNER